MGYFKMKKNYNKLIQMCSDIIEQYESDNKKIVPSCKADMLIEIKKTVDQFKDELSTWEDHDTDYYKIANTRIAHASFDLLASGKYHLYYGILNPMSCASKLMTVYNKSMEEGLQRGEFDEAIKEEQLKYLKKCISEVG